MPTKHADLFAALAAPFEPNEVKSRSTSGRQMHYITARTAMNRLDDVLGPENWWDSYSPGENSVLCLLTIRLPDGSTLTKADAGGYAGMADSGDDDKSGYSDSFKRACVKFGVGRYLYRDGVPSFARGVFNHGHPGAGDPAPQPGPAPAHAPAAAPAQAQRGAPDSRAHQAPNGQQGGGGNGQKYGPPKTGKALFAWSKDVEQQHEVGMLKYLNQWAKLQDFPGRMVDWDAEQVALAYEEGQMKIQAMTLSREGGNDDYEEAISN